MSLEACLADALGDLVPVPAEMLDVAAAYGYVVAEPLALSADHPATAEALRAGYAVAALDLIGASTGTPVPLDTTVHVLPGAQLPAGTDAVLPEDGTDNAAGLIEVVRPIAPGEGARRAGHDGRLGDVVLRAGTRIGPRQHLLTGLAGMTSLRVRRPRVRVLLDDPVQSEFAVSFLTSLGACPAQADPLHLTLRTTTDHRPRLALACAETAWLSHDGAGLVLSVPTRFDAMVTACLALALPAMAALTGGAPRPEMRPLLRKVTSNVGLSELVLLADEVEGWLPQPAGIVTLTGLATARAFAIVPPDSEGCPAGAPLAAVHLDFPFG